MLRTGPVAGPGTDVGLSANSGGLPTTDVYDSPVRIRTGLLP
jgi:hypothetical protein